MELKHNRREAGAILLGAIGSLAVGGTVGTAAAATSIAPSRRIEIEARPEHVLVDLASTAVLVIDMQNDFGSPGGLFDRVGVDIAGIRAVVPRIQRVLAVARAAKLPVVYLKMGYRADLSDAGPADGPNLVKQRAIGQMVTTPDGRRSRILVRDTWNTEIVPELAPQAGDAVLYKTRYSGFVATGLHPLLRRRGIRNLIVTGCTTSVCVESTVRDAMFLDYRCVLLEDCMAEPQGEANHAATLAILTRLFAWVSDSAKFASALG